MQRVRPIMDSLNHDQDRSLGNEPSPSGDQGPAALRFVTANSPHFRSAEPKLPAIKRIRLVVVHPNSITRYGIHHAWSTSSTVQVCGVANSWEQLRLNSAAEQAQVGLFGLPVGSESNPEDSLAELAKIIDDNPHIKWIVMANQHPDSCQRTAYQIGASGFVESDYTVDRLESMIQWIAVGRQVGFNSRLIEEDSISESTSESTSNATPVSKVRTDSDNPQLIRGIDHAHDSDSLLQRLSARELEVLEGLAAGKTNQQIANTLFLSVKTIETYRSRLKQKLGLKDRAEMVAYLQKR